MRRVLACLEMNSSASRLSWTAGIGFLLLLLTLALVFLLAQARVRVAANRVLPVMGQVADFALTNQDGRVVTPASLSNRVWVADIIFTRCAGPCLKMSRQMKELQDALPSGSHSRLVTLTTDPSFDTPAVLTRYAERFGADTNRWMFLTGTKEGIAALAVGSLKFNSLEKKVEERESASDLFVHSTIFEVVDKQGRLRAVFETGGEGVNWQESKTGVLRVIQQLEREP
jgi:protein SCO1/2